MKTTGDTRIKFEFNSSMLSNVKGMQLTLEMNSDMVLWTVGATTGPWFSAKELLEKGIMKAKKDGEDDSDETALELLAGWRGDACVRTALSISPSGGNLTMDLLSLQVIHAKRKKFFNLRS